MLHDLGEQLGRLQLAAQVGRDGPDHRLEDLGQPAVRGLLLVVQVALGAIGVQVVEECPGLVLLGVQAGQAHQPAGVVAGVDHLGAHPIPVVVGGHLQLLDVEAEFVQAPDALLHVVAHVGVGQLLLVGDLVPERLVPADHVLADRLRVDVGVQLPGRLQVEHLAEDVHLGDLQVLAALAVGQARVQRAGLGVDEVRGERARVAPEQRVGQRHVAPEEAGQVHPDQQRGERVEQPVHRLRAQRVGEQRPVRQGELQVPGDQHGRQRLALAVEPVGDDGHRLHARGADAFQLAEQVVLALGDLLDGLLDGVDGTAEPDEPDDVPGDALRQGDQPVGRPLLQRNVPGQVQQGRVEEGRSDAHGDQHPRYG